MFILIGMYTNYTFKLNISTLIADEMCLFIKIDVKDQYQGAINFLLLIKNK